MKRIAVALTCHNRREKTLACLDAIRRQQVSDACLDIFLVDDGSTDGTSEAVGRHHPDVRVIRGDGNLYWNGGMRVALAHAYEGGYDYYLWLNDDTTLDQNALDTLLQTSYEVERHDEAPAIIVGSTRDPDTGHVTYGGRERRSRIRRSHFSVVEPGNKAARTETMNGNIVLVPAAVAALVGNLDPGFRHAWGDQDYGLRAQAHGCSVWVAAGTLGACRRNPPPQYGKKPVTEELRALVSMKGLPPRDWARFTRRWAGALWALYWLTPYLRRAGRIVSAHLDGRLRELPNGGRNAPVEDAGRPFPGPLDLSSASTIERSRRSSARKARARSASRVLIIVQNLPVPLDRRVWMECQALVAHGYEVTVVCPRGPGDPPREVLQGVELLKYSAPPQSAGSLSYAREFVWCWVLTARLVLWKAFRDGFDVIQACNPPDTYFALAAPFKLFGKRFVFDHHDLSPEMYISRFGKDSGMLLEGLRLLERLTFWTADRVVSTNESYAHVAHTRGRVPADRIAIVQSGPNPTLMSRGEVRPELRRGHAHMVCWLGIMGPQDGVDVALQVFAHFVHEMGREDTLFAILGFGDAEVDLRRMASDLLLEDHVHFTGRADQSMIAQYLSTADLGLVPDHKTAYADLSTHNKTLEYMAFGLPVLTSDLAESCRSAGEAARVVPSGDVRSFAHAMADLLDDPPLREAMGAEGRRRIEQELGWQHQARRYVSVFDEL